MTANSNAVQSNGTSIGTVFGHLCAGALAAVFLYAAKEKIADPVGFKASLHAFQLFPVKSVNPMAIVVPWWELFAGVAILIPGWRKAGAIMTGGMGVIFLLVVSSAVYRGLDISCGCFGHGEDAAALGWQTIGQDILIIAASIGAFLNVRTHRQAVASPAYAVTAGAFDR